MACQAPQCLKAPCLQSTAVSDSTLSARHLTSDVSRSRDEHGKYSRIDYDHLDVTGGEAIESAHGGALPGHIIDMCLTQCSAISEGLV